MILTHQVHQDHRTSISAIEDREFQTRIGGERDEVRALLQKVHDQMGDLRRAAPE